MLPNQFSYPTTITLASLKAGYNVHYIPTHAALRTGDEPSKIRPARDSLHFFTIILKIVTLFSPMRVFAPISSIPGLLAIASLVLQITVGWGTITTAVLLMTMALFLFCIGLVSEQITALRFERSSGWSA